MDALFWVGQVVWLCILACGAYVSFCFADLADAESARTVTPEKVPPEFPSCQRASRGFEEHVSKPASARLDAARRAGRGGAERRGGGSLTAMGRFRRDRYPTAQTRT